MSALYTMIGNANIYSIDIALVFIFPVCIALYYVNNNTFRIFDLYALFTYFLFTILLAFQSLQVPELQNYCLWPIKAFLVVILLVANGSLVTKEQYLCIFAFALLLYITSNDEGGRAYGLFGPNMLYRFYGVLFIFTIYLYTCRLDKSYLLAAGLAISVVGILSTGSAGGILTLIVCSTVFINFRLRYLMVGIISLFFIYLGWDWINNITVVERIVSKLNSGLFTESVRINGILTITSGDFSFFGHPYSYYNHIWEDLYVYPHNIFAELYAFFGVSGVVVIIILISALITSIFNVRERKAGIFDLIFIALLPGTIVSGDLSDNYGLIGMGMGILIAKRRSSDILSFDKRP